MISQVKRSAFAPSLSVIFMVVGMSTNFVGSLSAQAGGSPAREVVLREVVDLMELNHCLDHRGNVAFRQLICYEWSGYHRRFQVRETVVVQSDTLLPKMNPLTGRYSAGWSSGEGIRIVEALSYRVTRTRTDPEVPERYFLAPDSRRPLARAATPSSFHRPNPVQTAARPIPEPLLKR